MREKEEEEEKGEVRRPNLLNFLLVLLINTCYFLTFATSSELCLLFRRVTKFSPLFPLKKRVSFLTPKEEEEEEEEKRHGPIYI